MCCENKATKRNYISQSSALLYDQIISPRTNSSSIEMPESGYNTKECLHKYRKNEIELGFRFQFHFNLECKVFTSYIIIFV